MKTILVSLAITALGAGTAIGKPKTDKPQKADNADKADKASKTDALSKLNFGESYELKGRKASKPRATELPLVRSISDTQASRIIRSQLDDVETCWLRIPAKKRTTTAVFLKLTIEALGNVSSARVEGELPAGVDRCITTAAARWRFPVTDARAEIEHGITLTTRDSALTKR